MSCEWRIKDGVIDLSGMPKVMGIVNVTPDSFSDGGQWMGADAAIAHGLDLVAQGADIVDVGGESTRPGSDCVTEEEELSRVLPVIEGLRAKCDVVISVDTTKCAVARSALDAGAQIVNDVSAMRQDDGMTGLVAQTGAGVVLMHMLGTPKTMQASPVYVDVVGEVGEFLASSVDGAVAAGIPKECIVVDPGIGFGKTVEHNLELISGLDRICATGAPVLVGASRKAFIGKLLDVDVSERLEGTLAVSALAVAGGARIVRVHDVRENVRAVRLAHAIAGSGERCPACAEGAGAPV